MADPLGSTVSALGTLKRRFLSYCVPRYFSFNEQDLLAALGAVDVGFGDVLMVHASLGAYTGFTGSPRSFIDTLKRAVGDQGTIMMPSMSYQDSSKAFLLRNEVMNVMRTPSRMGLLSEVFRRGKDVKRSLSPIHPILAWGRDADYFTSGHHLTRYSIGEGSPFEKLLARSGKNLCINVPLEFITFSHHIEHLVADRLPVNLYEETIYSGVVVDYEGNDIEVPCYVLSDQSRMCRRDEVLTKALKKDRVVRHARVGNTHLYAVSARDYLESARKMLDRGEEFYCKSLADEQAQG